MVGGGVEPQDAARDRRGIASATLVHAASLTVRPRVPRQSAGSTDLKHGCSQRSQIRQPSGVRTKESRYQCPKTSLTSFIVIGLKHCTTAVAASPSMCTSLEMHMWKYRSFNGVKPAVSHSFNASRSCDSKPAISR